MTAERILVIDDEPAVIRVCQRALGKEGFEVKGTLSGEKGLQLLKRPRNQVFHHSRQKPGFSRII